MAPDDQLLFFFRLLSRCSKTIPYVTLTGRPTLVPQLTLSCTFSCIDFPQPSISLSAPINETFFLRRGPIFSSPSKHFQTLRHARWRLVDSHSQFRGSASNVVQTRIRAIAKLWGLPLALALLFSSPLSAGPPRSSVGAARQRGARRCWVRRWS